MTPNWTAAEPFLIAASFQIWSVLLGRLTAVFTQSTLNHMRSKTTLGSSAGDIAAGTNAKTTAADLMSADFSTSNLMTLFGRHTDAISIFSGPVALLIAVSPRVTALQPFELAIVVGAFVLGLLGYVLILVDGIKVRVGWFSLPAILVLGLNLIAAVFFLFS